jgi:hypothetical protein
MSNEKCQMDDKMNERRDDTTETNPDEPSTLKRDQEQHGYYYDDETGYEVYDPSEDEDDDENVAEQSAPRS